MRKKRIILVLILLMAVGFATLATSIFINGSTIISVNQSDFKVLFTKTVLDDVKDNSLIVDDTHIVFTTNELKNIGDKSVLEYTIKNNSKNYNALLSMTFTPASTDYIRVTNVLEKDTLESDETTTGTLTVELIKGYVGEEALEESISVEITASAVERDTLGEITSSVRVSAKNTNGQDVYVSSETIVGHEKEELINDLKAAKIISEGNDTNTLINLSSENIDDLGEVELNVSEIAEDGTKILILYFDSVTNEWKFISEETVNNGKINLNVYDKGKIAFALKKDDGTYEVIKLHEYVVESGDLDTVCSVVSIGDEQFIVFGTDENDNIKLISKNIIANSVKFSETNYWVTNSSLDPKYGTSYSTDVYDENSSIYSYIDNYYKMLKTIEPKVLSARLVKKGEESNFSSYSGNSCLYRGVDGYWWTGIAVSSSNVINANKGNLYNSGHKDYLGIRPVIILQR